VERKNMIPREAGFNYAEIVYDVAEYDDSDFNIERTLQRNRTTLAKK
jgi:hypothetical protein